MYSIIIVRSLSINSSYSTLYLLALLSADIACNIFSNLLYHHSKVAVNQFFVQYTVLYSLALLSAGPLRWGWVIIASYGCWLKGDTVCVGTRYLVLLCTKSQSLKSSDSISSVGVSVSIPHFLCCLTADERRNTCQPSAPVARTPGHVPLVTSLPSSARHVKRRNLKGRDYLVPTWILESHPAKISSATLTVGG